jgi:hypothetical protein
MVFFFLDEDSLRSQATATIFDDAVRRLQAVRERDSLESRVDRKSDEDVADAVDDAITVVLDGRVCEFA